MHDVSGNPTSYSTALAPEDRDPAYQLFVQEAVELFQQVETDLHPSEQSPSSTQLKPVIKAIQIIRSGAIQLNLTTFQYSVHRLETICSTVQTDLLATEIELLCQICQTLKLSLLAHIQKIPTAQDIDCAAAQVILVQLEKQLQNKPKQAPMPVISATEITPQSPDHLTALALSAEVEDALLQVESQLASSPSETLASDLSNSFENLRDLGEMSNFSELVAISQTALASLQASPRTAATIGKIALAGYREAKPPHDRPDAEKEAVTQGMELPASTSTDEPPQVIIFDTADAFVWQTGGTIFVLPSNQILEIIIPTPEQVDQMEAPTQLHWQERKLPIYPLTQFISEPKASLLVTPSRSSFKKSSPLLVIQQHDQHFALKIEIERLITVSALELQNSLKSDKPDYERGSTFLDNSQLFSVVDVEMLLKQEMMSL